MDLLPHIQKALITTVAFLLFYCDPFGIKCIEVEFESFKLLDQSSYISLISLLTVFFLLITTSPQMFLQHWPSIAYLYVWPESERLKKAIQDGIDDPVHTIPVIRNDEPLKDEVSYAIQQLQLNQPPKQTEYSLNKNGLKALIVSNLNSC